MSCRSRLLVLCCFFFFKQKTAYEMRISDWSSDVCSSDLIPVATQRADAADDPAIFARVDGAPFRFAGAGVPGVILGTDKKAGLYVYGLDGAVLQFLADGLLNNVDLRSEERRVGKEWVRPVRSRWAPYP